MTTKESKKYNAYKDLVTAELFELLSARNKRAFKALTERLREIINGLIRAAARLKNDGDSFSFKWTDEDGKIEQYQVTRKDIRQGFTAVNETLHWLNTFYDSAGKKAKKEFTAMDQKGHFSPAIITPSLMNFFASSLSEEEAAALPNLTTTGYGLLATVRDTFYYIANTKGMQSNVEGEGDVLIPSAQLTALLNSRPKYMYEDTGRFNSKGKPVFRKVPLPASSNMTTADVIQRAYGNKGTDEKGKNKSFNKTNMRMFYLLVIISLHSDSGTKLNEADLKSFRTGADIYAQEYESIIALKSQVNSSAANKKSEAKRIERQHTVARNALLADIKAKEEAHKRATKKST